MSSVSRKKIVTVAGMAAVVAVAGGCSSFHHETAYNQEPVPITGNQGQAAENFESSPATGATGNAYQTQSGSLDSGKDVVIPLQKEQLNVTAQDVSNGSLRVRKTVKTRTVTQPVQIREETVTVERGPDNQASDKSNAGQLNTPFQEGEITIPLMKEQPLVQTQVVPNGSVVIRRHDRTQTVNAQGQVRSEHVAVDPIGNPQNVNISSNFREGGNYEAVGAAPVQSGQSSGTVTSQPITRMNDLCAGPDLTMYAGRPVNLTDVPIEKVVNDHTILVKGENGINLLVKIDQSTKGLRPGERVSLNGTVEHWPANPAAMGWGPSDIQGMQHDERIYIAVPSIAAGQ